MAARTNAPQVLFLNSLTQVAARANLNHESTVLIYDQILDRIAPEFISLFPIRFAVAPGESLKTIQRFASLCERLAKSGFDLPARTMTVLAAGGGSVGDFAGFFASVYKRGVRLVHLPTTWLAAIDSAHGGKTALNVGGVKNQIGTFYPAAVTCLVRSVLESSGDARVNDAFGELAKIALIDGGRWVKLLESSRLQGSALLWKFLKPAIEAKMKIVRRDPREEKGVRQVLNLGHTFGHVLESAFGLSHGSAVTQGLYFAIEFSYQRRLLKEAAFERAMNLLGGLGLVPNYPAKALKAADLKRALLADKKRDSAGAVTFIYLRDFGRCERRSAPVDEIVTEARRQGWAQ